MAKTKQRASSGTVYARRLVRDEDAKRQLGHAAARMADVYGRAATQRGRAVEDKTLYSNLREAATSIRSALMTLGQPPPEPKRRGRKLLTIAAAGCAAALVS